VSSGPEPATVFHLIYSLAQGGAEVLTADLSETVARDGRFRPVVCAWKRGGPLGDRLAEAGIRVHVPALRRRPMWTGPVFLVDTIRIVRTIACLARTERARILHAHLTTSAFLGAVVGAWLRCPLVVSVYSNHLIPLGIRRGTPRFLLWKSLYRWALGRARRIIAVSGTVRDSLERDLGVAPHRVTVIPNGVAVPPPGPGRAAEEVRRELGLPEDARLIVFVGRLVPNKNQSALIDMMAVVRARVPEARLVLVGEGPSEAELRRRIASRKLEDAVVLAGRHPDVPAVLRAADVFATASVTEGISLAVLEALAAGVPVAGLRSEGNEEVLVGGAGVLVDGTDPARLGAAVADLLEDDARRAALASAGAARVAERYRFDRMVERVIDLYEGLAPGSGGGTGAPEPS